MKKKINIVIYTNCGGRPIRDMFSNHAFTKTKTNVSFFQNWENLHKKKIENDHKVLLNNCDIFIYQPMNKNYDYSEYDIQHIQKHLKSKCKIIRVNYYRTKAFWYQNDFIPYLKYKEIYTFNPHLGIHNDFSAINNSRSEEEIVNCVNNIEINERDFFNFFNKEVERMKVLDQKSDVKMYNFFMSNYKKKLLFFDRFHPTNIFIYEIFRQLVGMIFNHELLQNDDAFLNSKEIKTAGICAWSTPILPSIKKILKLEHKEDLLPCFNKTCGHNTTLHIGIYDYHYIRLSPDNFEEYLNRNSKNV